ncbi:MAG: hypothetical protein GF384_07350 [Elusimicrobia bacterium]|nr:hypothetical protein [Elusimicrobiota bacterium]
MVTSTWIKISSHGEVRFENLNNPENNAEILSAGTYVLRLSVTDELLTSSDDVTVTAPIELTNQEGLEQFNYMKSYEKDHVDPDDVYSNFGGVAFDPVSRHLFMVEDKKTLLMKPL